MVTMMMMVTVMMVMVVVMINDRSVFPLCKLLPSCWRLSGNCLDHLVMVLWILNPPNWPSEGKACFRSSFNTQRLLLNAELPEAKARLLSRTHHHGSRLIFYPIHCTFKESLVCKLAASHKGSGIPALPVLGHHGQLQIKGLRHYSPCHLVLT